MGLFTDTQFGKNYKANIDAGKSMFKKFIEPTVQANPFGIFDNVLSERKKKAIKNEIAGITPYEIPSEVSKLESIYGAAADEIRGLVPLVEESTKIAKNQTNLQEAPGMGIAQERIRESAASNIQNIMERGGGSTSVLGAITDVGNNEMNAIRALAMENQKYRQSALKDYQGALRGEASAKAGIATSAAQLEASGLTPAIQQQAIKYGYDRSTEEALTNFDIIDYSNWLATQEQKRAERNQMLSNLLESGLNNSSDIISSVGSIATLFA